MHEQDHLPTDEMTVTVLGWILLPLSLAMIVVKPDWVYAMAIFFLPFSATAVINLGSGQNASGIQVWLYLTILLLFRWCIVTFYKFEIKINREIRRPILYLSFFVAICVVSLLVPLWINGRLQIMSPLLLEFTTAPLVFSSKNITACAYILVGFGFTLFVANKNTDPKTFRRSSFLYLLSCVFVAGWGVMQLCLNVMNFPYPAMIFNNSASPAAAGYLETMDLSNIARLTSVAVEPSMLVQTLLIGAAFTVPAIFGTGYVWGRYRDRLAAFLLIGVCIAATSSTGYLGIALLLLLIGWNLHRSGRLRARVFLLFLCGVLIAAAAYSAVGLVQNVVNGALLSKGSSYSALERGKTIYYALQYFLDYPILGVGWGSVTSHDVVAKLLSNTGIVGFTAFCTFVGVLLVTMVKRSSPASTDKMYFDQASVVLFLACVEMLVLATITEFPDVFGHFWFILGMASAATLRRLNTEPVYAQRAA